MKRKRILIILFSIVLVIAMAGCQNNDNEWKERISPLPDETVQDLCSRLNISIEDVICNGDEQVYALDFFPYIQFAIIDNDSDLSDFEMLVVLLEPYIEGGECYESPGDNGHWNCNVDLGGGMGEIIWALFDSDGSLIRMRVPTESW